MTDDDLVSRQIVILGRKIRHRRNLYSRNLDLTSEQADAIRFFADHPQQTIADFRTFEEITHQTARLIVHRLVQKGLITLQPSPTDGRAKLVHFTVAGLEKQAELEQHIWQTSATLFADFTPTEQRQLLTLLRRASDNLAKKGPEIF